MVTDIPASTDSVSSHKEPQADPGFIELPREGIPIRDIVRKNDRGLATDIATKAPDKNADPETFRRLLDDAVVASFIEYFNKANNHIAPNKIRIPRKLVLDIAEGKFPLLRPHTTVQLHGATRSPSGLYTPAPTTQPPLSVGAANTWLNDAVGKVENVPKLPAQTVPSIKTESAKTIPATKTTDWIQDK